MATRSNTQPRRRQRLRRALGWVLFSGAVALVLLSVLIPLRVDGLRLL